MKNIVNRTVYLAYYCKKADTETLGKFLAYASLISGKSRPVLLFHVLKSIYKYNIGILDYFYFRFYDKDHIDRLKWAGTGYLYEYQLRMNPQHCRQILENKIEFLNAYSDFVKRDFASIESLKNEPYKAVKLLNNPSGKIVLKLSGGQVGAEVKVFNTQSFTPQTLQLEMQAHYFDLAEEYVVQHNALMALSPSGLNTIRIFTQLDGNNVVFLGARLRISVNSQVDNLGAGNIAAPVDMFTGIVNGPGVYSDITKKNEVYHPVTHQQIEGFQVPFWKETLTMVEKAALLHPQNRSIGWDIAITNEGPELIEGNHNWCKLLWQLPVKQGLKHLIENYK